MRKLGFPGLVGRVKGGWVSKVLYRPLADNDVTIAEEDRRWLYDYFSDDVKALEELLGADLSGWLR